jgi:hypothetical protein
MSPDPYQASLSTVAQLVVIGIMLIALFLLCGWRSFTRPPRTPSPEPQAPRHVGRRRPEFVDWLQCGWDLPDPSLPAWINLPVFDEPVDDGEVETVRDWIAESHGMSVVDRRVQSDLYPGRVPLREVTRRRGEAS